MRQQRAVQLRLMPSSTNLCGNKEEEEKRSTMFVCDFLLCVCHRVFSGSVQSRAVCVSHYCTFGGILFISRINELNVNENVI